MGCDELAGLAAEFDRLANHIGSSSADVQHDAIQDWLRRVPDPNRPFAYRLISIYKARSQLVVQTGSFKLEISMSDESTHVTAGGDIVGSAVGKGAKVDAQIIQSIKGNVDTSANIDAKGQAAFKEAIDEVAADSDLDKEEKEELLAELEKLRA